MSLYLPAISLITTKDINPIPMPSTTENVVAVDVPRVAPRL